MNPDAAALPKQIDPYNKVVVTNPNAYFSTYGGKSLGNESFLKPIISSRWFIMSIDFGNAGEEEKIGRKSMGIYPNGVLAN